MREAWSYQKPIIARSIPREYTMVNAACGTGKSLIAIHTAIAKGRHTLIITPKNVMADFKEELLADGVKEEDIWVYRAEERQQKGYYHAFLAFLTDNDYDPAIIPEIPEVQF